MIDWQPIKMRIKPLFAGLLKLPLDRIRWRDESEGSTWMGDPAVLLRIKDILTEGQPEERREDVILANPPTDPDYAGEDQEIAICAQKRFTLSVRVESFTQDISDPGYAGNLMSNLETRLCRTSTVEALSDLFAISDTSKNDFVYEDDQGRALSVFVMDISCLTVDNDDDDTVDAGGWIGETIIHGDIDDAGTNRTIDLDVNTLGENS